MRRATNKQLTGATMTTKIENVQRRFSITIGDETVESSDRRLWSEAGFVVCEHDGSAVDQNPYAYRRLARALSEGHSRSHALMRAVAIGEEEARLGRQRELVKLQIEAEGAQISRLQLMSEVLNKGLK
jgi:hypothetical protein